MTGRRRRLGHDARVFAVALGAALPAVVVALVLLWSGDFRPTTQGSLTLLIAGAWVGLSARARRQAVRPLQTIANLLAAVRQGDFSTRAHRRADGEALDTALAEVNAIGETLREQRLGAVEASALLDKVILEIDVVILAFDGGQHLRLCSRSGERLLCRSPGQLLGQTARDLGLATLLEGQPVRTLDATFPGARGQWDLRRSSFRQHGFPHQLVVLTDLGRALREEERQAWQRLVRVLGHEINNSLAPIRSIAAQMQQTLQRQPRPADWQSDLGRGLAVVERRAEALGRFMRAYATLARLPPPRFAPVDVGAWFARVAALDTRVPVSVQGGVPGGAPPPLSILGDTDQLDQLLINLVRNAIDASLETNAGAVTLSAVREGRHVVVTVADRGPGIAETSNLFVPFFTTKAHGSGIGLVLSRQIAEAHHGDLELHNRAPGPGCEAVVRLPS